MRQLREEGRLDHHSLVRCHDRQRLLQRPPLLVDLEHVVGLGRFGRRPGIAGTRIDALLSLFEAQAVDRPGTRLVHDPSQHAAVPRVVAGRPSPDVVEDVQRQLLGGFPIAGDSHD
jgi:hypothetical protein